MKGISFVNGRYTPKRVPFLIKMVYKRGGVGHHVEPPRKKRINSLSTPNSLEKVKNKCDPDIYTKMWVICQLIKTSFNCYYGWRLGLWILCWFLSFLTIAGNVFTILLVCSRRNLYIYAPKPTHLLFHSPWRISLLVWALFLQGSSVTLQTPATCLKFGSRGWIL